MKNFLHSIKLSPKEKGMILAFLGYTAFSFSDTFGKFLSADYSVYQITGTNYAVACLVLLAFSRYLGGFKGFFDKHNLALQTVRGVLNFAISLQVVYSISLLPLSSVYTMIFAMPFFAILISVFFFKDKVAPSQIMLMAAGFSGVLIAFRPWENEINITLISPLICSVFIAVMFSLAKILKDNITVFALGFTPLLVAFLINLPFMIGNFQFPDLHTLPLFLGSGLCVCCGIVMVSLAFRTVASAIAAPFLYIEMIWGLLLGYMIFGDKPDLWMMAGAAVIMGCGYILVRREH
jgi:drug/metabolite transporter (DMT)-like permease